MPGAAASRQNQYGEQAITGTPIIKALTPTALDEYLPASQLMHAASEVDSMTVEYLPSGHAEQVVAPVPEL
jgi:hypothetical protein